MDQYYVSQNVVQVWLVYHVSDHYCLPDTQSEKQFWIQEAYSTLEQTEKKDGEKCHYYFSHVIYSNFLKNATLGIQKATIFRNELSHRKEVCPASKKTH